MAGCKKILISWGDDPESGELTVDDKLIAGRLEEINEGLCAQSGGIIETHFRKSKRIGAAVRIANLIKGQDVVDSYYFLLAAAGELRISADTLDKALCDLEEIGYVTIQRSAGEIVKIEERVPLLEQQYAALGEKWRISNSSEIEKESILLVDDLMIAPQRERALIKSWILIERLFQS